MVLRTRAVGHLDAFAGDQLLCDPPALPRSRARQCATGVCGAASAGPGLTSAFVPAQWSAADDRHLIGLLTKSAPHATTE
ncbi:hypothetical protein ABIB25_005488 [Nakamurella sp. UYEF19]